MTAEKSVVDIKSVLIKIRDIDGTCTRITLKRVYVKHHMNIGKGCIANQVDIDKWPHLSAIDLPRVDGYQVHLLIGQGTPQLLIPEEVHKGLTQAHSMQSE